MTNSSSIPFSEWDLLNAIAQAHNAQDMLALFRVIMDDRCVFKDKPRCLELALESILLTQESVDKHKDQLLTFMGKIQHCDIKSLRSAFRFGILEQLLNKNDGNALADNCDIE